MNDAGHPAVLSEPTMTSRHFLLAPAIALALAACGQSSTPPAEAPVAAPATAPAAEPAPPVEAAPTAPAPIVASKPATVSDCATTIEANDAMQFNADAIAIPASCAQFTINLKHIGTMPVAAMGHNVVVSREADMAGIAADGMSIAPEHVKPGDARVIAHTKMIGGGESTSVSFEVAKLKDGGPYVFFCSFPGHMAIMKGSVQVQ